MKLPARNIAWLLPLLLTGCFHNSNQPPAEKLAPPIIDVPPPSPEPAPGNLPPAVMTIPGQETPVENNNTPSTVSKPVGRRHKPSAKTPEPVPSDSSGVSAIGKLSTGDPGNQRQRTVNSITSTEGGLNSIHRKLNDQEQKTADQIREYLKQARAALNSGDEDGARTLAVKARVLLGELGQ
jgi:hypothetical protein